MGGTSETTNNQQQQSVSAPWGPAQGLLGGILGQLGGALGQTGLTGAESGALEGLRGLSPFLGQFVPALAGFTQQYIGGGPDRTGIASQAYGNLQSQLAPTIGGQYLDPNTNPWFSQVTQNIGNDVQKRVQDLYAGGGRDPAGAGSFPQTLGRGIAEGVAPVFANAYNAERGRQLDAMSNLFGAGGQTAGLLGNLDQLRLGNAGTAAGLAGTAQGFAQDPYKQQLSIEAMLRGIPLSNLQQIAGLGIPIAGLGGQTNTTGTSVTTKDPSFMEDLYMGSAAIKNLFSGK